MQRLWQDLGFSARRLMKRPGLILVAILTPALGAGFTQVKTTTIPHRFIDWTGNGRALRSFASI